MIMLISSVSKSLRLFFPFAAHCVKSVCIWSYSGPHFPEFGLNT